MNSKRVDTATYYCEASNMYGKSTFNVSLVVLGKTTEKKIINIDMATANQLRRMKHIFSLFIEMPDSPRNLRYSQLKSNSVSFTWEQPFDGNSPLIGYQLNYKPVDG